jgi:hypothetical protein
MEMRLDSNFSYTLQLLAQSLQKIAVQGKKFHHQCPIEGRGLSQQNRAQHPAFERQNF